MSNLRLPWKIECALNSLYWIYTFYHSKFWTTCDCPGTQSFPWIFHCNEILFTFQDFWATCARPENRVCPDFFQTRGGGRPPDPPPRTPLDPILIVLKVGAIPSRNKGGGLSSCGPLVPPPMLMPLLNHQCHRRVIVHRCSWIFVAIMLLNAKLPFLTRQSLYASPKKYKQSTFYKNTICFLKWHKCEGFPKRQIPWCVAACLHWRMTLTFRGSGVTRQWVSEGFFQGGN